MEGWLKDSGQKRRRCLRLRQEGGQEPGRERVSLLEAPGKISCRGLPPASSSGGRVGSPVSGSMAGSAHTSVCVFAGEYRGLLCSSRPTPTSCWTPPHLPVTSPPYGLGDHLTYSGQCNARKPQGASLRSGPRSALSSSTFSASGSAKADRSCRPAATPGSLL